MSLTRQACDGHQRQGAEYPGRVAEPSGQRQQRNEQRCETEPREQRQRRPFVRTQIVPIHTREGERPKCPRRSDEKRQPKKGHLRAILCQTLHAITNSYTPVVSVSEATVVVNPQVELFPVGQDRTVSAITVRAPVKGLGQRVTTIDRS